MKLQQFYNNRNVLITGGLGFIGSHLAHALLPLGAQVTIFDNNPSYAYAHFLNIGPHVRILEKTITDPLACLQATEHQEIVFHCAAFISVPRSFENPSLCHQVNVEGTFNLLEASRLHGVERFIFASTAAVYGDYNYACHESLPCNPQSPYGYSKLIAETYCQQYAQLHGLSTVSLRYFNVVGNRPALPGIHKDVITLFTEAMHTDSPITIYGNGSQTRDFISVDQVVKATLTMGMQAPAVLNGDRFNIGSGTATSILDIFNTVKNTFPSYNHQPIFKTARHGDCLHSLADCSKFEALIKESDGL